MMTKTFKSLIRAYLSVVSYWAQLFVVYPQQTRNMSWEVGKCFMPDLCTEMIKRQQLTKQKQGARRQKHNERVELEFKNYSIQFHLVSGKIAIYISIGPEGIYVFCHLSVTHIFNHAPESANNNNNNDNELYLRYLKNVGIKEFTSERVPFQNILVLKQTNPAEILTDSLQCRSFHSDSQLLRIYSKPICKFALKPPCMRKQLWINDLSFVNSGTFMIKQGTGAQNNEEICAKVNEHVKYCIEEMSDITQETCSIY